MLSERGREPGFHLGQPPLAGQFPGAPCFQPPQPPPSSRPPATAPSPLEMSSERGFLQSAFEAAPRLWADLAPGQGGRASGWGGVWRPESAPLAASDPPPPSPASAPQRRSQTHEGDGEPEHRPQSGPDQGAQLGRPLGPAGEPWGQGPHKALLWLRDGRHRVAFVPPLTLWRAQLIAGPGRGRVTCQTRTARWEPPLGWAPAGLRSSPRCAHGADAPARSLHWPTKVR